MAEKSSADPGDRVMAVIGLIMGALMLTLMFYAIAVARGWTGSY